jgi:hypothetical protein
MAFEQLMAEAMSKKGKDEKEKDKKKKKSKHDHEETHGKEPVEETTV